MEGRRAGEHAWFAPRSDPSSPLPSPPRMTLFVTSDRFLCTGRTGSVALTVDKRTYAFGLVDAAGKPPDFAQQISAAAILGVIHRRYEAFLVVVTDAVCVGTVCGAGVFGVRRAALLPFELQASAATRSRSDAVAKEVRDLEHTLATGGFYFSHDVDLSSPRCVPVARGRHDAPYESDEYCWNKEMAEELRALPAPYNIEWAAALIFGSVQAAHLVLGNENSVPPALRGQPVSVALVARRSRCRAWQRCAVGLDEEGYAAGQVSSQLFFEWGERTGLDACVGLASLQVIIGSCPLIWANAGDSGAEVRVGSKTVCRESLLKHAENVLVTEVGLGGPAAAVEVALLGVESNGFANRVVDACTSRQLT